MPARTESGGHRRVRRLLVWAASVALAGLAVPVVSRLTGWEAGPFAVLVSFMPWITLAAVVPVALAALARAWALTAVAGLTLALCVAWQAPLAFAAPSHGETVFTVATANLSYGDADAGAIVAMVRDSGVDALAVQELTPDAVDALRAAGLEELLPYSVLRAEEGYAGTGLWSRLPLAGEVAVEGPFAWTVHAEVRVEGEPVTLVAVHPAPPGTRGHAGWAKDLDALAELLADVDGAVVVAGDFNTTRDHAGFRRLEGMNFEDAADQAGAGLLMTFPEGTLPTPLVAIDHVLERDTGWVATGVDTVVVPQTDHRALVVEYTGS